MIKFETTIYTFASCAQILPDFQKSEIFGRMFMYDVFWNALETPDPEANDIKQTCSYAFLMQI